MGGWGTMDFREWEGPGKTGNGSKKTRAPRGAEGTDTRWSRADGRDRDSARRGPGQIFGWLTGWEKNSCGVNEKKIVERIQLLGDFAKKLKQQICKLCYQTATHPFRNIS